MTTRILRILLVGIILLGGFLRLQNLGNQSLWIDEGYTINGALAVAEHGKPLLDSGARYENGLLTTYLIGGLVTLLPLDPFNPWQARIPSAVFGVALILFAYYFSNQVFKKKTLSFLVATAVAFSSWQIVWSQQARGYTAVSFFILVTLYFLWKFISDNKKYQYIVYSLFAMILGALSHDIGIIVLPGYIAVLTAFFVSRYVPMQYKTYLYTLVSLCFSFSLFMGLKMTFFHISSFKDAFFFDLVPELVVLYVLFLIGLVFSFFQKKKNEGFMILATFIFVTTSAIVLYAPSVQMRYLFPLHVLLIISACYTIFSIFETLLKFKTRHTIASASFGVYIVIMCSFMSFMPTDVSLLEKDVPQPDYKSVFKIIQTAKSSDDVVVSAFTQLHKVYLGEKGFWLKVNLSGRYGGAESKIIDGRDYYAGATIMEDIEAFKSLVASHHGFVIVDYLTSTRFLGINNFVKNDSRFKLVFSSPGDKEFSGISLYKF
jgi:hypothetical protein